MQDRIVNVFKTFREKIYHFFSSRRDAAFELVDALSSNTTATRVVELSLNPVHRRNYCSITRVVDEFYPENCDKQTKNNELTTLLSEQCVSPAHQNFYLFGVDCTPNPRRYAPTQQIADLFMHQTLSRGTSPLLSGINTALRPIYLKKSVKIHRRGFYHWLVIECPRMKKAHSLVCNN